MAPGKPQIPRFALSPSDSQYSLMEFMREFPDDAVCLEWLWRNRYSEDGETRSLPEVRSGARLSPLRDFAATPVVDVRPFVGITSILRRVRSSISLLLPFICGSMLCIS